MNAGELDKRVQLLRRSLGSGPLGNPIESWHAYGSPVWAKVEWITGNETFSDPAARRSARQRRRFTVRYRPDLDPTWRVEYDGVTYDVKDVQDVTEGGANGGRRKWVVLIGEAIEVPSSNPGA